MRSAAPFVRWSARFGKSTFAGAVATDLEVPLDCIRAKDLKKKLDFTGVLSSVRNKQIVLLQDLDAVPKDIMPLSFGALTDYRLSISIGTGPGARLHSIPLPRFTCIATCTDCQRVPKEFRPWFSVEEFESYSESELLEITKLQARELGISITDGAAQRLIQALGVSNKLTRIPLQRIADLAESGIVGTDKMRWSAYWAYSEYHRSLFGSRITECVLRKQTLH